MGIALETMNKRLARTFHETRIKSGISVETLASKLDLSPRQLAQLEAGRGLHMLPVVLLAAWAARLGLEVSISVRPYDRKGP